MQVQQRDNEIALLINMLKGRGTAAGPPSSNGSTSSSGSRSISSNTSSNDVDKLSAPDVEVKGQPNTTAAAAGPQPVVLSALLDASLLSDRHKAFEVFRHSYRQGQVRLEEGGGVLHPALCGPRTLDIADMHVVWCQAAPDGRECASRHALMLCGYRR